MGRSKIVRNGLLIYLEITYGDFSASTGGDWACSCPMFENEELRDPGGR